MTRCVPFADRFAGCLGSTTEMLHLPCRASGVPASSTSVGAQCRRQTDTSILSVRARHTNAPGPSLAAVSPAHWFQIGRAHLSMSAQVGVTLSVRLHPACRRLQSSLSPVVVILAASDTTYTWLSTVGDCAFPVAGSHLWNSLPRDITTAPKLAVLRKRLKSHLFSRLSPYCF